MIKDGHPYTLPPSLSHLLCRLKSWRETLRASFIGREMSFNSQILDGFENAINKSD